MQQGSNSNRNATGEYAALSVVKTGEAQASIEREIDQHINSVRALIRRMLPSERQRYYNGLLAHILSEPVDSPSQSARINQPESTSTNLSREQLELIREMAVKMEQLYRVMDGYDPS